MQNESSVVSLFSTPLTCVPFGAGFDLSVLALQTYGQRGRREHTLLVGRRTYVGLSKRDLDCILTSRRKVDKLS